MQLSNLFTAPGPSKSEVFEDLLKSKHFRLERIVSTGQSTPAGQWLSQAQCEWVVLLSGSAALRFEGEDTPVDLRPGDYLTIPAHQRHRVEWTDATVPTVWLALHWDDGEEPSG